jgi:hypothetical protein
MFYRIRFRYRPRWWPLTPSELYVQDGYVAANYVQGP